MNKLGANKTVLIIGLGNIAVGYDVMDTLQSRVLTHARAFSQHPAFKLSGGVDPDPDLRIRFETAYSLNAFATVDDAMKLLSPDIIVIATPTALHLNTLTQVFLHGHPKIVLCEKPLSYRLDEARQIVRICELNKSQLFVNFFRLSEPGVAEIRARLADGRINKPVKGVVWYSKGIMNSGAHFLNLLQNLLGEIIEIKVIRKGRIWEKVDPEPDVDITFPSGRILFLAAREEDFFHNSMELISSNGRLRYESSGEDILWQGIEADQRFKGYIRLDKVKEKIYTDYDRIQWNVVEELATAMSGRRAQICTGVAALRTQEVLELIKEENEKLTT